MSSLFTDDYNRANGGAGANYTDLLGALNVSSNRVVGSGGTWVARIDGGSVPASDCYVEMDLAALPTGADSFSLYLRTNLVSNNGYRINFTSADATIDIVVAGTPSSIGASFSLPSAGQKVRFEARGSSLLAYYDDTLVTTRTDASYTGGERSLISGAGTTGAGDNLKIGNLPTISSATPSGTLGTSTTATIGCTTDDSSGTLYVVVDTASLSGITEDQIKAGQNASSVAADAAGNSAVSGSSPSVGVTGLSASTAYNYAILQFSGGNSNILTGTFTTAAGGGGGSSAPVLITGGKIISFNGKLLRFG